MSALRIPADLLPIDGRFGAGPAKVPSAALTALANTGTSLMGTSHRQAPVRGLVRDVTALLREFFAIPDDYAVVMGNGGSTAFWDIATFCLIEGRSQHASFGEFTAKFAQAADAAPFLAAPSVVNAAPGGVALCTEEDGIDAYAWAHNETSTAVMSAVRRVSETGLMLVDGTSAAAGIDVDPLETDAYYFAPQKGFASDGGLWIVWLSPAAQERARRLCAERWVPAFLDLSIAMDNSVKDQTYNTPAIATLFLMREQLLSMVAAGGLSAMSARTADASARLYSWAEASERATPFVTDPALRSQVIATIDFDGVSADDIAATLRANGIADTEPYRKLGRNQLRVASYPAIDPDDMTALTRCIDFVVERLAD